jgi:hypothetical protein
MTAREKKMEVWTNSKTIPEIRRRPKMQIELRPFMSGPQRKNLAGQIFGQWTVLTFSHVGNNYTRYWLCQCSCGRKRRVLGASLKAGQSKRCRSCGAQIARAQIRRGYLSVTANGVTTTLAAQCRLLNLTYEKVRSFMRKHGVSAEQAIAHYERRSTQPAQ